MLPNINKRTWFPENWDEFFGNSFLRSSLNEDYRSTIPAANVSEEKDKYIIEFAAPGMSKKDFKIDLHNNMLTVSSSKEHKEKEEKQHYMRREFSYSSFSRSFTLPESIDADKIKAKQDNGILRIVIPKKPEAAEKGPKQIEIS